MHPAAVPLVSDAPHARHHRHGGELPDPDRVGPGRRGAGTSWRSRTVEGQAHYNWLSVGAGAAVPLKGDVGRLLQLDRAPGLLDLGLELVGLLALDALLDGLRRLVDERLGLLQAETGRGAHDLDHLDLLVARSGEDHVDRRRFLFGAGAAATGRGRTGRRRAPCSSICRSWIAKPPIIEANPRTSPVSGEASTPTNCPCSTSRAGSRAMASSCSTVRNSPAIVPPLNSSSPFWRRKVAIAFAASAGSPATKVNAVGPSSSCFKSSAPALSAARTVSRFLTIWNRAPASDSCWRSSIACLTEMPR